MKITKFNRKSIYFRKWSVHPSFARKGGGVLSRDEPRWRNFNGICLSFPNSQIWLEFRRAS
jgi:hypothetical protein